MLLEFKVKNFKSFKEEAVFSMIPTKIKELEYSVLKQKADDKEYKALSSAVVYGPNAAGKTNIIEAMEDLKEIIMTGNILDKEIAHSPNISHSKLELIPNINSSDDEATVFSITFLIDKKLFTYFLSIRLGKFLNFKSERTILEEKLLINNYEIFSRYSENEINLNFKNFKNLVMQNFKEEESDMILKRFKENINSAKTNLFLTSVFRDMYSGDLVKIFEEWFSKKFIILCSSERLEFLPDVQSNDEDLSQKNENILMGNNVLDNLSKQLGIISKLGYGFNKQKKNYELVSTITSNGSGIGLPAKIFESLGTLRIVNILPVIVDAVKNGKTLVIDEFDASIHPMVVMSIIKVFHNDEINKKGAQLIFNTHNPIFLDNELFRRDEIKFVDKDEDNDSKSSVLYSLSDFGTNSDQAVRKTTDYMKNYFMSRYGAIKDIDFSDIFRQEMNKDDK